MMSWAVVLVIGAVTLQAAPAAGQDTLARAKEYYASASYEEALQVLTALRGQGPGPEAAEAGAYQVFCLVALGRNDEARRAIESVVRADPLYHPSEAQVSPRIRAFFEQVRLPLLPDVVKRSYAKAKSAFDRKDLTAATSEFDGVIALLDEMSGSEDQALADLRTLASGFRELSRAASAPPKTTPPPPPPGDAEVDGIGATSNAPANGAGAAAPAAVATYGVKDANVKPPVAISQTLPTWNPANPIEAAREFRGVLELVIAEDGSVVSAVMTRTAHAGYDPILLRSAQDWKFKPATRGGVPVRYRLAMDIRLSR